MRRGARRIDPRTPSRRPAIRAPASSARSDRANPRSASISNSLRGSGGREWESNPPGTGSLPHSDLKSGRPTGDDSPPFCQSDESTTGPNRSSRCLFTRRKSPLPQRNAVAVEEFEDLDRHLAPVVEAVAQLSGGERAAFRRRPPRRRGWPTISRRSARRKKWSCATSSARPMPRRELEQRADVAFGPLRRRRRCRARAAAGTARRRRAAARSRPRPPRRWASKRARMWSRAERMRRRERVRRSPPLSAGRRRRRPRAAAAAASAEAARGRCPEGRGSRHGMRRAAP